jgi:hypothetical protein
VDPLWKSNCQTEYPTCSSSYTTVSPAVIKMFYEDYWCKDMGFFVNEATARKLGVNTSVASWAVKYNKVKGRPISNHSRVSPGMVRALNSEHVKAEMEETWGKIKHPTISVIIRMILSYVRDHKEVPLGDLRLWSCDLAGAFTLLDIHWKDIQKMGLIMAEDLVWISLVGSFGWTGTPFCFDVITRICRAKLAKGSIHSYSNWYCDDGIGIGRKDKVDRDIQAVSKFVRDLLGPTAICEEKNEKGRGLNFIGYFIDLDSWTVSVKESNLLKTLRGYFSVKVHSSRLTLKDVQRLASWGSRYGLVCPYLTPFIKILWQEVKKRYKWGPYDSDVLTDQGKGAVAIIRCLLLGSMLRKNNLARSLWTFGAKNSATVICEFDACLSGIGIIWYSVVGGCETPVGVGSWSTRNLQFGRDSQYQNKSEFLAGLLAVMGLKVLGLPRDCVLLRGDSITALGWAKAWSFKGDDMVKEALVYIHSIMSMEVCLAQPEHIAGENNTRADELSRRFEEKGPVRSVNEISREFNRGKNVPLVNWDLTPLWNLFKCELDWTTNGLGNFWQKMLKTCSLLEDSASVSK